MKVHRIAFDGDLLERGFWLYAWIICHGDEAVAYVGRTGDSSSQFAASPFSRLSQHLDVRKSASANMLLRRLRAHGWDPLRCQFELVAFGPMFPEQPDLASHREKRDRIAPLEAELAAMFRQHGWTVLGTHGRVRPSDSALREKVWAAFQQAFNR